MGRNAMYIQARKNMHRVGACMLNINDIYVMFDMTSNCNMTYDHGSGPANPIGPQKMRLIRGQLQAMIA